MKRFLLTWVAPVMVLLLVVLFPVIRGEKTFFLRDVFNSHLPMKTSEAASLLDGRLPLVAPELAGGQALIGNPNSVPLYPDNALYLVLPLIPAFNVHFWLHLLLAPFAVYWLARRWGLDRPAAWAAGVIYTTSGFFISAANFYNLIAGVTLTPALMAAMLWAFEETTDGTEPPRPPRRRWSLAVVAGLWALLLLSGDPTTALVALVMSGTGLLLFRGRWVLPIDRLLPVLGALTLGALVTAPQWIEFLRILPLSSRGYHGVSDAGQVVGGFEPVQLLEGVLPYVFGRPDLVRLGAFWGHRFYGGTAPLFFTLYPGLLAVALAALALLSDGPRTRRLRIAALWAMGLGVALALGEHNPLVNLVRRLPGADLLRFPIKFWLPVALGLALLAGAGFERWARSTGVIPQQPGDPEGEDGRREEALARRGLLGLVTGLWVAYLVLWSILSFVPRPVQTLLRSWIPSSYSVEFVANERVRLAGLALVSLVFLLAMLAALLVALRAPRTGGVLLLVTHTAGQLFLLQPGLATDDIDAYLTPPPLLASIPADSRLVHGSVDGLFGDLQLRVNKPWTKDLQRQMFLEMFPPAGILAGRRYELNRSPEGLASYFTWVARDAVSHSDDVQRLRLLASWGVNRLLVARPLDPAASSQAHLLASQPTVGEPVRLFAVRDATPEVFFARRVHLAPSLSDAIETLRSEDFDPRDEVVLAGGGPVIEGGGGSVEVLEMGPESMRAEVETEGPGAVVWQRTWLPIYQARVDGEAAPVEVANVHRMAVRVAPGRHRVEIRTDRRPLYLGFGLSLFGLLGLVWLVRRRPRQDWPWRGRPPSTEPAKTANMSGP